MKILHFIEGRCNPDTANGVDKTIYFLTRELAAFGHEVHLISETKKDPIEIPGVSIHRVEPFRNCFSCPPHIRVMIDEISPDIGHFHSAYVPGNISLSKYLRKKGIPYVVTPNGNCARVLLKRRPWLKLPYKHFLERPYMNQAVFVHSVGDRGEIEHYGVKVPIVEALNGIDPATLPESFDPTVIEKAVPRFEGRFVCVFVGRLDIEQKALDLLISAVASLGDDAKKIGIVLVGPEWKGSLIRIEEMIRECQIEDSFHLYGSAYGDKKFDLVKGANAFIYPSRWEGLPFAVVEAMAVGQLCLVTPASDPAGLLEKNKGGVVFPSTLEGIQEALRRAITMSPSEREKLLASSAQVVRDNMTWDIIGRIIEKRYLEALKKN
jgi:glycosyltransferase involved in cell wall biosynthesis